MARGAGPQEWNKLTIHIHKISSLSILKTQLKAYLFRLAYPVASPQMYSSQRSICLILFTLYIY